jgi:hypothetical protein
MCLLGFFSGRRESLLGVFLTGEMLDWEAPTGGNFLRARMATGHAAGLGVLDWPRSGW